MAAQREEEGTGRSTIDVNVQLDMLECPICHQPLKPPVLQCAVGHVICSSCHGNLKYPGRCCYCSSKKGYNRCHVLDDIVESIQVPCSNAKYGCAMKTNYYQREVHERTCPHAPCACFCPVAGCSSFAGGPARTLLGHLTDEHHWPSIELRYGCDFSVGTRARVYAVGGGDDDDGHCFFLHNVASEPFGLAVPVFCVRPLPHHEADPKFRVGLGYKLDKVDEQRHKQYSAFHVPSTTLSDGVPRDFVHFIVPKLEVDVAEGRIQATINRVQREKA